MKVALPFAVGVAVGIPLGALGLWIYGLGWGSW